MHLITAARRQCLTLNDGKALNENNGKLVFVTGPCTSNDTIIDSNFLFAIPKCLRFKRSVEMLQYDVDEED